MFIRTYLFAFRIPVLPIEIGKEDLLVILLVLAWLYVRQKRPNRQRLSPNLDVMATGLLLGLLLVQLPLGWINAQALNLGAVLGSKQYFYFPLSFFVWGDILRRFTRDEVWQFLSTLSLLTISLMVLYGLSAIGFDVYPQAPYQTMIVGSSKVVRDFLTFPYWTKLAIAFWLVQFSQRKAGLHSILALGVLAAGTLLSLTRSYVFPLGVIIAIAGSYSALKLRGVYRLRNQIVMVVAGIGVIVLLSLYAPANIAFLAERVGELHTQGISGSSLGARFQIFGKLDNFIGQADPVFGVGFTKTNTLDIKLAPVTFWGDMMWLSILVRLGWTGTIALATVLMIALWNSFALMLKHDSSRSQMGLLLFMVMVWDVGRTFTSEGYLWFTAASTLPLAMIAVEKHNLWAENPVTMPRLPILHGVSLNFFTRNDRFWLLRRLALYGILGYIAYQVGKFIGVR